MAHKSQMVTLFLLSFFMNFTATHAADLAGASFQEPDLELPTHLIANLVLFDGTLDKPNLMEMTW